MPLEAEQLTTPENTITYHNALCHPKILHKHCLQFLLGVKMAPRETENNAYAKFWGDKQRALWDVMVFSGVVNRPFPSFQNSHFQNEARFKPLFV